MGMSFTYNIKECNQQTCNLDKRRGSIGVITKQDPNHWHLIHAEGMDWVYKTQDACLAQLCSNIKASYKKIYPKGEL